MVLSLDLIREPVGSIKPWLRALASLTVPANYLVCDGSLVSDSLSPFNGLTIPDMRSRHFKGHSTGTNASLPTAGNAGVETGGTASVNFNHQHNIGGDGGHSHGVNGTGHSHGINSDGSHGHAASNGGSEFFVFISSAGFVQSAGSHQHGGSTSNVNAGSPNTNSDGNHNHGGGTGNNLGNVALDPVFSGFVYIIRYK